MWAGPCSQGCCIRHSKLYLRFLSPLTTFSFPHRACTLFKPLLGQSIHRKDCFFLSTPASPPKKSYLRMRLFLWAGPCSQGCCIRHSKLSLRFLSPFTTFSFPHQACTLFKPLFGQSIHRKDCFSLSTPASPFFPCHTVWLFKNTHFDCILGLFGYFFYDNIFQNAIVFT